MVPERAWAAEGFLDNWAPDNWELLIPWVWGGAWEFSFPTGSQVLLAVRDPVLRAAALGQRSSVECLSICWKEGCHAGLLILPAHR